MIILTSSGKGGTGKTTSAVNLALSLPKGPVQLIDSDAEEPNPTCFYPPPSTGLLPWEFRSPELTNPNALTAVNVQSAPLVPSQMAP